MNSIYENIMSRRSVRAFTDQKISKEDLETIAKAGCHAPTGMNKQSWQFTITQDKEKIKRLSKLVEVTLERPNYNMYQPNAIIMVSNEKENTNGLADTACALENIFLMAHSMGIGSVWINQLKTICDEPEVRATLTEFGIPKNHIVYGIAALGYDKDSGSVKEKREDVIKFID